MNINKTLQVIIPSWAKLNVQMQAETGAQFPAFITVRGLPLWVHIVNCYELEKDEVAFIIVLANDAPELDLSLAPFANITTVRLQESHSIADTVLAGLNTISHNSNVMVHMADTLVSKLDGQHLDAIYVQQRPDLYRWTSVAVNESGVVTIKSDRASQARVHNEDVCTGVFLFSDSFQLKDSIQQALTQQKTDMDPFFAAIEMYSSTRAFQLINTDDWRDFGHVDSYYEARLNFHNLRHFNELSYDADIGVVTKRSTNVEAFRHQVRWFKQMPDELSYFLPKVYEMNDGIEPFISMEFLSIPTLNDLFVTNRLELGAWNDVARKINHIMTLCEKYEFYSSLAKNVAIEMYINKTRTRLQDFIRQNATFLCWIANKACI